MNMVTNRFEISENTYQKAKFFFSLMVLIAVASAMAQAGGTDTTFDGWVDQMTDWMEGSLGKGVSIAFILVGIVMGVVRQSLMAFAIGVGAALGLNYAPTVVDTMFSAVIL